MTEILQYRFIVRGEDQLSLGGHEMTSIPNQSAKLPFSWHLGNGLLGSVLAVCGLFLIGFLMGPMILKELGVHFTAVAAGLIAIFLAKRAAKRMLSLGAIQEPFLFAQSFHVGNILLVLVIGFLVGLTLQIINYASDLQYILNLSKEVYLLVHLLMFPAVPLVVMETVASLRAERHIKSSLTKGAINSGVKS